MEEWQVKTISLARRLVPLLVVMLSAANAYALPPTHCNSPYAATESLFGWLQPDTNRPDLAARCLDPRGRTPEELQRVARHVKAVYDAKALFVEVDKLSKESSWVDPDTGLARFAPHPGLPDVVVERQADGQWRWTADSLDRIEALYGKLFSVLDDETISHLPSWLRGRIFGLQFWQYLALMAMLLLGVVVYKAITFVVARRVQRLAERFGSKWASTVVTVLSSPLAITIMGGVFWLSYPVLRLPVQATVVINLLIRTLIIFSIVWAAYRLTDVMADILGSKAAETDTKLDDQLIPLVRKSLKLLIVVAGLLLILQNLNINVASLLAGLGIGGLAVAFAAKDTLANFFGSIMIFLDRPFQIGDWIVVDGVEGIVEEVGFRSTRIRTFYNSLICIPNSRFTDRPIDNYGERRYRRIFTTLGVSYDTTPEQMQAFVEGIRAIIRANPYTRKDYYEIHMSGFGASALEVMVYFFFELPTWTDELRERHNVFLEIIRLAKDLNISFAFPTQTLHVESLAKPGEPRQVPPPKPVSEMSDIVLAYGPGGVKARPHGPTVAGGLYAGAPVGSEAPEPVTEASDSGEDG